MAILSLFDERMFWEIIMFPRWRVAANGDDFSLASFLSRALLFSTSHIQKPIHQRRAFLTGLKC